MDKVLILGSNGFAGTHFQAYAAKKGLGRKYSFTGADIAGKARPGFGFVRADLTDDRALEKILASVKPDYILNFAAAFNTHDGDIIFKINCRLPRKLLELLSASLRRPKKILLVGSAAEYGNALRLPIDETHPLNPVSLYGLSKVMQSQYAAFYSKHLGLPITLARTFNIIGRGMPKFLSLASFSEQILKAKKGGAIQAGNLDVKRDFLDIEDVVDAYWKILLKGRPGETYNVCSGKPTGMRDILHYMIKKSGKDLAVKFSKRHVSVNRISDSYGTNAKLSKDTGWKQRIPVLRSLDRCLTHENSDT